MISPNQPSTSLSTPITLGEFQSRCDVMEGYVDLGLLDEAIQVMQKLTSDLRLTDEGGELFMNVLMKTNAPALSGVGETGRTRASLSFA